MSKTIIDAEHEGLGLNFKELYRYRDLFMTLTYRDFKVRYAQTFLGFAWAFIQPVVQLAIMFFVFGVVADIKVAYAPTLLFIMAGQVSWSYFSFVMTQSGNSIIGASGMISKIYFPRLIIPLSKAVLGFIDFGIAFLLLIGIMIYYQFVPSINIVFLPLYILLTILTALTVGIFLSSLTIRYRDFQHMIPFMVQIGYYLTPIGYPFIDRPEITNWMKMAYYMNPMAGIVEGYRWSILGGPLPNPYCYISFGVVTIMFVLSLYYFRKTERIMVDII